MRGAGRLGSRSFKPPRPQDGGKSYDPFELPFIGDLPVAPMLTPINDNFSWSVDADPADPRDCSRYPSSPYCGELPFSPGPPFAYKPEIRSNGCETCIYVYPVILWLMATPQVICYRDPNCNKKQRNGKRQPPPMPDKLPENGDGGCFYTAVWHTHFIGNGSDMQNKSGFISPSLDDYSALELFGTGFSFLNPEQNNGVFIILQRYRIRTGRDIPEGLNSNIETWTVAVPISAAREKNELLPLEINGSYGNSDIRENIDIDWKFTILENCGYGVKEYDKRPKPPPPSGDDDDRDDRKRREREKKRGKRMCCNVCSDAADNTAVLLREIKAIKKALGTGKFEKALNAAVGIGDGSVTAIVNLIAKRLGTNTYPVEVPQSLLTGVKGGDDILKVQSLTDYMYWLTNQLDALIGEFPIDIEVRDIDPLTAGDQKKTIQLTNIAESLAEIYGLAIKGSVNQEAEQAILLRLAIEAIAIKNGVAITQDYVRANTKFLGYKGNPVDRELDYAFDFTTIDLKSKDQTVTLDKILTQSKGYIKGWENEDKDTAIGFFEKLMFSAGIIKAVFFRDKNQVKEMGKQTERMLQDDLDNNKKWKEFVQGINNPNSIYNKGKGEQPDITVETRDPNKPI